MNQRMNLGQIITKIKSLCLIENNKRKSELIYYTYFFNTDTNEEKLLEGKKLITKEIEIKNNLTVSDGNFYNIIQGNICTH